MADDWNTVTVIGSRQMGRGAAKSSSAVNAARRRGEAVDTEQKYGAAQNKHVTSTMNTAKLDRETEELKHDKVPMEVGRLIQKGRQDKGWTQKDLATKICEKPQVVNEYESSKAVPNQVWQIHSTARCRSLYSISFSGNSC